MDLPFVFQGIRCYVQGPGVIRSIGARVTGLAAGNRACVVFDKAIVALAETVQDSLREAGMDSALVELDGDIRKDTVHALADRIREEHGPHVIVGVGGGKAIDVSKIVAHRLGARCVVCATSSSTDAAPSHAAVLLDPRGQIDAQTLDGNPDMVIVDSEVIAAAPVRLFVAGIGDAISKKYEMEAAVRLGESNAFGGRPVYFVSAMADALHGTLFRQGREAKQCIAKGILTDAVEQVITSCVLLSALVWENGGLAGAHSIANVLTNAGHGARNLHGELVAFGLLVFLSLEGRQGDVRGLDAFYRDIGLPRSIGALGISIQDRAAISGISRAVHERYKKHDITYSSARISEALGELETGGA